MCFIIFTMENEKNNRKSFLEVNINRKQGIFASSVYHKSTLNGIYTHFDSFLPYTNKSGMLHMYIAI